MERARVCLLLGAGFSNAFHSDLPVVRKLGDLLGKTSVAKQLDGSESQLLLKDPEALLSKLALELPWKTAQQRHRDLALFLELAHELGKIIRAREATAFEKGGSRWAQLLVKLLHQHRIPVISLNYDTVIERIASQLTNVRLPALYQAPILSRFERSMDYDADTFHLMKLHGSINWYYSGPDAPPGDQVYYLPMRESIEAVGLPKWGMKDRELLVVPPLAEKGSHFRNLTLRWMWRAAAQALGKAEHVYCIGYSLPKADLAMRLLLGMTKQSKGVSIDVVNKCKPADQPELKERYRDVFRDRARFKWVGQDDQMPAFVREFESVVERRPTVSD